MICNQVPESVDHLFSGCILFSSIWKSICSTLGVLHPQSSFRFLYFQWIYRNFHKRSHCCILTLLFDVAWSCWKKYNTKCSFKNFHRPIRCGECLKSFFRLVNFLATVRHLEKSEIFKGILASFAPLITDTSSSFVVTHIPFQDDAHSPTRLRGGTVFFFLFALFIETLGSLIS